MIRVFTPRSYAGSLGTVKEAHPAPLAATAAVQKIEYGYAPIAMDFYWGERFASDSGRDLRAARQRPHLRRGGCGIRAGGSCLGRSCRRIAAALKNLSRTIRAGVRRGAGVSAGRLRDAMAADRCTRRLGAHRALQSGSHAS